MNEGMNEDQFKQFIKDYRYLIKQQTVTVDEALEQINQTIEENNIDDFGITQEQIVELLEGNNVKLQDINTNLEKVEEGQRETSERMKNIADKMAAPLKMLGKMRAISDLESFQSLKQFLMADVQQVIGEDRKFIDLGIIMKDFLVEMKDKLVEGYRNSKADKYTQDDQYEVMDDMYTAMTTNSTIYVHDTHAETLLNAQNKVLGDLTNTAQMSYEAQQEAYLRELRENAERRKGMTWWQKILVGLIAGMIAGAWLKKVLFPVLIFSKDIQKMTNILVTGWRTVSGKLVRWFLRVDKIFPLFLAIYDMIFLAVRKLISFLSIDKWVFKMSQAVGEAIGAFFDVSGTDSLAGKAVRGLKDFFKDIADTIKILRKNGIIDAIFSWFEDIGRAIDKSMQKILKSRFKLIAIWNESFEFVVGIMNATRDFFIRIGEFWSKGIAEVMLAVETSTNPLVRMFKYILKPIKKIMDGLLYVATKVGVFKLIFAPMVTAFREGVVIGFKYLGKALVVLTAFIDFFIGFFKSTAPDIFGKVVDGFMSAMRGFLNPFFDLVGWIVNLFSKPFGFDFDKKIIEPIKEWFEGIYRWLSEGLAYAFEIVAGVMNSLVWFFNGIFSLITGDIATAKAIFGAIGEFWTELGGKLWKWLEDGGMIILKLGYDIATKAIPWIVDVVWRAITGLGNAIVNGITWLVVGAWNLITGFSNAIVNAVTSAINGLIDAVLWIINLPVRFFHYVNSLIESIIVKAREAFVLVFSTIPNAFNTLVELLLMKITDGFTNFVTKLIDGTKNLPGKIWDSITSFFSGGGNKNNLQSVNVEDIGGAAKGGMIMGQGIMYVHPNEIIGPAKEVIPQIMNEVANKDIGSINRQTIIEQARLAGEQLLGIRQVRDIINTTKQTIESTSKENNQATMNHIRSVSRDRQQPKPIEPPADIETLGVLFFNKTWGIS